jgi:hypothetical protein
MSSQKDKNEIIRILDDALLGHLTVDDIKTLSSINKKSLKLFSARIWQLMAIIESKILNRDKANEKRSLPENIPITYGNSIISAYYKFLATSDLSPVYPKNLKDFSRKDNTFYDCIARRAVKTLSLSLRKDVPTNELMLRGMRVALSSQEITSDEVIGIFDVMLNAGCEINARVMDALFISITGLSGLNDSEAPSDTSINPDNLPFFEMLSRYGNVPYTKPLLMHYHLKATNKTPMERLIGCKGSERKALLVLIGDN